MLTSGKFLHRALSAGRKALALACFTLAAAPVAQAGYVTACSSYDWNNWNNAYPWGNSHNGSAYMSSNQVSMWGNGMELHAQRSGAPSGYNFLSGTIYCKTQVVVDDNHLNWTIAGDFRTPNYSGAWPAMWLCYAYGWPPECDIMEFKGDSNVWQNTYLTNDGYNPRTHINGVSNPATSYHNYKIWMNRTDSTWVTIDYYIDGNWTARDSADFVGKPMNLIIDLQTEGSSGSAYFNDTWLTAGSIHVGYTAPDGAISNGTYKIIARNSGKAMDAFNQGTGNGTQIIQWDYWGGNGQKWTVTNTGSGNYKIIGVQSGKALDVDYSSGGTANGTKVQLWDYWGGPSQLYRFTATDSGNYRITPNTASGSCLDVYGNTTASGAKINLWSYWGGYCQQWSFQTP